MIIHYHGGRSASRLLTYSHESHESHVALKVEMYLHKFSFRLSLFSQKVKKLTKLSLINNLPYADSILMTFCQQVVAAVSRNEDLLLEDL